MNIARTFYISFESQVDAFAHRARNGGWIFVPDFGTEFIWFNPAFRRSTIMTHRVTSGLSGKIVCSEDELQPNPTTTLQTPGIPNERSSFEA
jgi:hypothetical protein